MFHTKNRNFIFLITSLIVIILVLYFSFSSKSETFTTNLVGSVKDIINDEDKVKLEPLNKDDYDKKNLILANRKVISTTTSDQEISKVSYVAEENGDVLPPKNSRLPHPNATEEKAEAPKIEFNGYDKFWPVKTDYPKDGAILPFKRIVAYYGNYYSKQMGVLGEYPENEMVEKLQYEVNKWTLADPEFPAIPAIQYIAVTAQGHPTDDGKYRLRMPFDQIEKSVRIAKKINGIVFLDIQVGLSDVYSEIPRLKKYLELSEVNLAIDPEFSMKRGGKPGDVIGTFDAEDINFVIDFLQNIVIEKNLPPKILVVHRFTQAMITNYQNIKIVPEVQIVIDMDGWGPPAQKINTYKSFIYPEPVEFTGFKLFYKNDIKSGTKIMEPDDLLKLTPRPIYIQYQ